MQPICLKKLKIYEKNIRALWFDAQKVSIFQKKGGGTVFYSLTKKKFKILYFIFSFFHFLLSKFINLIYIYIKYSIYINIFHTIPINKYY